MTAEPTYRIPPHVIHTHDDGDSPMAAAMCLRCMLELHIADGELVLDSRLQALADAWNELDYRDRHKVRQVAGKMIARIEDALTEDNER